MTDISLHGMGFDCHGKRVTIAFDPPMKSLREARERVVQLDKDALQRLGRSDITITKYVPPYDNLLSLFNFSLCLLVYAVFSRAAHLKAGSFLYDTLLYHFSGFANFCLTIRSLLLVIMVGIHVTETVFMAKKLRTHGLTPLDGLWWAWVGSCFVEGKTSFMRLDAHIDGKIREKQGKQH